MNWQRNEMRKARVGAGDRRGSEKRCLMGKFENPSRCHIPMVLELLRFELDLCMTRVAH